MKLSLAAADTPATPIHLVDERAMALWRDGASAPAAKWVEATGFRAKLGACAVVPGADGGVEQVLVGWGTAASRARDRFHLAAALPALPAGAYRVDTWPSDANVAVETLGWLFQCYRFERYKSGGKECPVLVAPADVNAAELEAIARAEALTRDLINTPANDMGPDQLEAAARDLANTHGATVSVTQGDHLLAANLPLIHAVGRAAAREPRLIDVAWGDSDAPTLTLVGKGVCFDTGGLNLKPGSSMGLMKKDMGGSATVLGLASMIMDLKLKLRLRVLIPAVENSVSGSAFRPGDILTARDGQTVEINNTDAEGRLVLADALALGDEDAPDLMICMATLTGAARVAVGPDLAPFYATDDSFSHALSRSARRVADPVWRMPFWEPYERMIEPGIADLDNAPSGGFAGSITAALFLRRFVNRATSFAHFDIYGWCPASKPGRPKGGVGQAARAILETLPKYMDL